MKSHPRSRQPLVVVVSVRRGIVEHVRASGALTVIVEDWDSLDEPVPEFVKFAPDPIDPAQLQSLTRKFGVNP